MALSFTEMKFLHIFAFLLLVSVGKLNTLVTFTNSTVVETMGRRLSTSNSCR